MTSDYQHEPLLRGFSWEAHYGSKRDRFGSVAGSDSPVHINRFGSGWTGA